MMGATSTARVHRCRQRKRTGKVQHTIETDEAGLEALLVRHGLLPVCGSDDRGAVDHALERLLQLLIDADAEQHYQ
jgi:hypothetical protein